MRNYINQGYVCVKSWPLVRRGTYAEPGIHKLAVIPQVIDSDREYQHLTQT